MGAISSQQIRGRLLIEHDKQRKGKLEIVKPPFGRKNKSAKDTFTCFLAGKFYHSLMFPF